MSGQPVSLQESFPEICETLKDHNKNDEVQSKSSNKTSKPNKVSYQLCQVLQDTCEPTRVTVIKESFSKQCKPVHCSDDPHAKSQRLIYCKEVIKPYIKNDGRSAEEIAKCAKDIIGTEFPNFKYCCTSKSPENPKHKVDCCIKREKKCKTPIPSSESECQDYSAKANDTLNVAKNCFKDFCAASRAAITKFNEMCNTDTSHKENKVKDQTDPPPHPTCRKKPKECSMDFSKGVTVIIVENPPVQHSETKPRNNFLDKLFNCTKKRTENDSESKHYLTKFYSIHSLLLLPLEEIEKEDEENLQKPLINEKQSIISESARQLNEQEQEIQEEIEEEEKLKVNPLKNLVHLKNETKNITPKVKSLSYGDDIEDDDEDDDYDYEQEDEDEFEEKHYESEIYPLEELNYADEDDEEGGYDENDEPEVTYVAHETKPSIFSNFFNKFKENFSNFTEISSEDTKHKGKDTLDILGENVMNSLESAANTTITTLETMTNIVERFYNDTTSQVSDAVIDSKELKVSNSPDSSEQIATTDQSSTYDVPSPKEVEIVKTISDENEIGFFSRIKSTFHSIFDESDKK